MYSWVLEETEWNMLFTWVTRGTGTPSSSLFFLPHACVCLLLKFFDSSLWLFLISSVYFVTTTFDNFKLQSREHLFQINVCVPIPLNFKRYSVLIQCGSRTSFRSWDDGKLSTIGTLSKVFQELRQIAGTKNHSTWEMGNNCKNAFPPPIVSLCRFYSKYSAFLLPISNFSSAHGSLRCLLPVPYHFLRVCFPALLPADLKFFNRKQPLHCPHWQVLHLGWHISTRIELRFPENFVQVNRISFHTVEQNPCIMKSLILLKQPSCQVFFVKTDCCRLF